MFDQVMARIAGRFGQVETRAAARSYLLGLLSGVERKNCRQLAERAGHRRPGPLQRLLRYARWDADAVRDRSLDTPVEVTARSACTDKDGWVAGRKSPPGFGRVGAEPPVPVVVRSDSLGSGLTLSATFQR